MGELKANTFIFILFFADFAYIFPVLSQLTKGESPESTTSLNKREGNCS